MSAAATGPAMQATRRLDNNVQRRSEEKCMSTPELVDLACHMEHRSVGRVNLRASGSARRNPV